MTIFLSQRDLVYLKLPNYHIKNYRFCHRFPNLSNLHWKSRLSSDALIIINEINEVNVMFCRTKDKSIIVWRIFILQNSVLKKRNFARLRGFLVAVRAFFLLVQTRLRTLFGVFDRPGGPHGFFGAKIFGGLWLESLSRNVTVSLK